VPITARYAVEPLARAMRRLAAAQGGPVHVAWVLISGYNTGPEEARELARLFRGVRVRVSVIDVNDPEGRFLRASDASGAASCRRSDNGLGPVRCSGGRTSTPPAPLASRARGEGSRAPVAPVP
jgi:hypothetical protein